MERTVILKKLVGLDPTITGIGSYQRTVHECTFCETKFDTSETVCPECGGQTFRSKTTTSNAEFNLLFILVTTGFVITFNVLKEMYSKESLAT